MTDTLWRHKQSCHVQFFFVNHYISREA